MESPAPVTFQVTVTPQDLGYAIPIIEHQLAQVGRFCAEVLLSVDHPPGRDPDLSGARDWMASVVARHPQARFATVDYAPETVARVSRLFLDRGSLPPRCRRGGYYSYFEGLFQARHDHVFHVDCDIMLGGSGQPWLSEAVRLLDGNPDLLSVSPLPGPPARGFELRRQKAPALPFPRGAYRFDGFTTRLFLLNKRRFSNGPKLVARREPLRQQLRALVEGYARLVLPEELFGAYMRDHGLYRIDFAGESPGLWSLHPPFRNTAFLRRIPAILGAVESGDLPAGQLGDYDINESLVDWSDCYRDLKANRWWRRYLRKGFRS